MPRKWDTVLSSEEESDGTVSSRRPPEETAGEGDSSPERGRSPVSSAGESRTKASRKKNVASRQKEEARKMAAVRRDGAGEAPNSPLCLGVPGQGSDAALILPEDQSQSLAESQAEGKLSLKDLKSEIFSYVKGAFQQEKATMREEMLAMYREQLCREPSSPPHSSRASPPRHTIRENKRMNPVWQTKAALKKPRLSPAIGADDSSDSDSHSREEGEVLSDTEDLEEIQGQTFQQSFSQAKRDFRRPYWNQGRQQFKKGFMPRKQQGNDRSFQDSRNSKA
uniref:Uncharacterized protein n=1 Tax=Sphaerodactylus townsendi TaxID=933632 RepID=A0ACB8G540_9SAUR